MINIMKLRNVLRLRSPLVSKACSAAGRGQEGMEARRPEGSSTDSAARMKSRKADKEQGPIPLERKKKGKREGKPQGRV